MRAIAVIGPSQSGKSTLIEGMAGLEGARPNPLALYGGTTISTFQFLGDSWTAIEVPGGRDFQAQAGPVLSACDAAVLCVAAEVDAAVLAAPYLRMLDNAKLPTFLFVNKIEVSSERVSEIVTSLQNYSRPGIVLRQVPIRDGGEISGVVDLISERAWAYQEGRPSALVELPDTMLDREQVARSEMLDVLADYDDNLLEQIIEDKVPTAGDVYSVATRVLQHHDLLPVFLGAAEHRNGLQRLLKSLRHETPRVSALRERLSLGLEFRAIACLADQMKHLGKITLVRTLDDRFGPRERLAGETLGGLNTLDGKTPVPEPLNAGEFALAIKSDHLSQLGFLTADAVKPLPSWTRAHSPAMKRRVHSLHERDEGKLSSSLARLSEIDPGLTVKQDEATGSPVIGAQGEQHLTAIEAKLVDAFGIEVQCSPVPTILRETIRSKTTIHHRHRKQSGGAGQFADVVVDVTPLATGSEFGFSETIKGGTVPRNYIPSVEAGARDALAKGPSGYPVVDIAVTLRDGKSHSVDSSDFAFRTAGHHAVKAALEKVGTTILQPILRLDIHVPSVFNGSLVQLVSGLKGQVLGFQTHPDAVGWDIFQTLLPMSSEEELSRALGGTTRGTAWYDVELDHFEELREPMKTVAT